MDSEVNIDGCLIDIIDEDWINDQLPMEDIDVPIEELPDTEQLDTMSKVTDSIGFIGGGAMAYAVAMGMISGGVKPSLIHVSNPSAGKLERFAKEGAHTTHNNMEILKSCKIIVICVKPQVFPTLVKEIKANPKIEKEQLVISVMGGVKSSVIQNAFTWARVIRTLPSTPCLVKSGIVLYCKSETSTEKDLELTKTLLSSCAKCILMPEKLIDAGQAISGCGPAFLYTALDALADGGVKMGLPRATALELAALTMVGTGKMYLETKQHPGELKDAVTSPGGVTICALHALDKAGFRAALIDAVEIATKRSIEVGEATKPS